MATVSFFSHTSWPTAAGVSHVGSFLLQEYMFIFCILLHLILVGTHVTLVVVDFKHQQFLANETLATDLFFFAALTSSNTVVKIFYSIVVTVTQGLTLRRNYHVPQSLTDWHEKSSAWLGLWSSLPIMRLQRQNHVTPREFFLILGYLATIFVLGVTDASLLVVGTAKVTGPILAQTTSYLGEVRRKDLKGAFQIVTLLPIWGDYIFAPGFDDSTVYDVPILWNKGSTSVDAVVFNVDCGVIPALSQTGSPTIITVDGNALVGFPIQVGNDLQDVVITPAPRSLRVLSPQPVNIKETGLPPTLFIVSTTVQITDDGGSALSVVDINPSVQGNASGCGKTPCMPVVSVQVVACNVRASNTTVEIRGGSLKSSLSSRNASWHSWSLPTAPSQPFLRSVGDFGRLSPPSDSLQTYITTLNGSVVTSAYNATMLEHTLMAWLNYHGSAPTLPLGELNYALQQVLAAVYWRASFRLAARAIGSTANNGNMYFQIQINKYTPWIGLGLSIVLLLIAVILTRPPTRMRSRPPPWLDTIASGSPGLLQVAWLMGTMENLPRSLIEKAPDPTLKELYKAGKLILILTEDWEPTETKCTNRPHNGDLSDAPLLGPDGVDDRRDGEDHAAVG
ncbi:hypothetical protein NM688_g1603 [Phlebia brevispora]|uniref:Uncharacterized protein n=1 Tax=Phlebia brevispora TaxID=194682 RepID=A0ACC1TB20_9APHY|nr:hypothetical protein NM688_g1603 [Phlebia brevispora]